MLELASLISRQAFSDLLEHIYMAPLMPERWSQVLDLLCLHTGSRNFFLLCSATFLLRADLRVLHFNSSAQSLLHQGDTLLIKDGCLGAVVRQMQRPLKSLVARALETQTFLHQAPATEGLLLERTAPRTGRACEPLHALASRVIHEGEDAVLLLISDPSVPVRLSEEALRVYFGLTPAECEVVQGLLTGYSLQEIAIVRKVSVGTVRQQLKAVFAKTRTSTQADLTRVVMTTPRFGKLRAN